MWSCLQFPSVLAEFKSLYRNVYESPDSLETVFPFEIHPPLTGGAIRLSDSLYSLKPQPLPRAGAFDGGFAAPGLQGLSCHYLSASSVLNCNPNVRSGPRGKLGRFSCPSVQSPWSSGRLVCCSLMPGLPTTLEEWRWQFLMPDPVHPVLHGALCWLFAQPRKARSSKQRPKGFFFPAKPVPAKHTNRISPIIRWLVTRLN